MKFKVLNAVKRDGVLLVTGCYSPEPDEQEFLEELRQVLKEVNQTVTGEVQCDRIVSNDKTILIKFVPVETVYMVLQLHNSVFDLNMKVVMGRNMVNNQLRPEVEQFFETHKF